MTAYWQQLEDGLDLIPDNFYLGRENISIVFEIDGAVTGTDDLGNPIRAKTSVTVEGRTQIDSKAKIQQQLPGTSNKYLELKVNLTKVDSVATTALPTTIVPRMIGAATFTQKNGGILVGQFEYKPTLDKSVTKIHDKVGTILYGLFEVMGDGQ